MLHQAFLCQDVVAGTNTEARKNGQIRSRWNPPSKDWIKIIVDASRKQSGSTPIAYLMKDNHAKLITTKDKQIRDSLL